LDQEQVVANLSPLITNVYRLSYPLLFFCPVAFSAISFASCQLEWMHSDVADAFERDRDNPFDFRSYLFDTLLYKIHRDVNSLSYSLIYQRSIAQSIFRMCRYLRFCNTREEFERYQDEKKAVLAMNASLEAGFARELAVNWIGDEKNAIIITQTPAVRQFRSEYVIEIQRRLDRWLTFS